MSALSIRSCASGQILQNTVPSIIQTKSVENEIFTPPISKEIIDKATVSTTNPIVKESRFELEKNVRSSKVSIHPRKAPRSKEATISIIGSTSTPIRFVLPVTMEVAIPKETANTASPTASSRATIGSKMSVNLPFALYWRTTINVAAGAVAVAIAPRTIAASTDIMSGITK